MKAESDIEFVMQSSVEFRVLLNFRAVGMIKLTPCGWAYYPKGKSWHGDVFQTLEQCKQSLLPPADEI